MVMKKGRNTLKDRDTEKLSMGVRLTLSTPPDILIAL
jgi:hypothetical protein